MVLRQEEKRDFCLKMACPVNRRKFCFPLQGVTVKIAGK